MAMVLPRAREKDSRVRLEKRKLEESMKTVTEQVEQLQMVKEEFKDWIKILIQDRDSLQERLTCALRSNEVLQADLTAEKSRNTSLSQQLSLLRVENRRVVDQQRSVSGSSRSIERKYNDLRYEEDAEYYRGKLESMKEELKKVRDGLSWEKTKRETGDRNLKDLQSKHNTLEKEHTTLRPLANIGADVRLRFLDQAREVALKVPREDIDVALRSNGNAAAHRADGAADIALFEDTVRPYRQVRVGEPYLQARYVDYSATLTSIKLTDSSSLQRRAYSDCVLEVNRHLEVSPEGFRTSSEVAGIVDRMGELTNEIIELERFRGGRRRRDTPADCSNWWE
ncbi:hypothetical protein CJF30_00002968 [Rutstroemia sp. NJR-2017a BBW]|nr:hypothetical protein CJF30_00002968 [Rutstroemia sp. NJR-2017a BBW]